MTPTCTLTVTSGPAAGGEVEVERDLIIGRKDADLTIPDEELSRHHAAVRPVETGVVVEDLGSLNGTFVDGERISAPVTLTADATIRVGRSEVSVQLATAAGASEPEEQAGDSGRTRIATVIPPHPDPAPEPGDGPGAIPQPQVTRVRAVPQEPGPAPGAIPQPQVTRVRAVPQEPGPAPGAIPQPQVTRVRAVPQEQEQAPIAQAQGKRPGVLARLLARLRGRDAGGESS